MGTCKLAIEETGVSLGKYECGEKRVERGHDCVLAECVALKLTAAAVSRCEWSRYNKDIIYRDLVLLSYLCHGYHDLSPIELQYL